MRNLKIILLFLAVGIITNSCRRQLKGPSWDADILAPIVKSTLSFNDLLADSLLQTNPDHSLTLVYNNNFYGLTLDSLIHIPDTTVSNFYDLPLGQLNIAPGQNIATINQVTQNNISNGVELTKVIIRSGHMNVQLRSRINRRTKITYTIPGATLNSVPFQVVEIVPARNLITLAAGVLNRSYDLSGYVMDLSGPLHNSYNTTVIQMIADVDPSETQNAVINHGDSVVIRNGFSGIVPEYAKGYFGSGNYHAADTSSFSMFNHIIGGTLNLDSVKINMQINNSVGADARLKINSLTSINTRTGNSISLAHPIINSPININRAFDNNGTVIPSVYSVQLDNTNSNIKQMIENLPNKIGYSIDADLNPLGNVSGGNDFIYYGSGLRINLDMEVPLWFSANHLTLVDTLNYSISSEEQNVNNGTLTLFADNGFPFEASVQLFILNSNNTIIDSLMPAVNTIDEGVVNGSYIVTQTRQTKLDIPISTSKINELYHNHKIYVKVKLNTFGYPHYVKIYDTYNIALKIVGDFNYHVVLH